MSNSKILVPTKQVGAIKIKNLTGGEINWEQVIPAPNVEEALPQHYYLFKTFQLRKFGEELKKQRGIIKAYSVKNGIVHVNRAKVELSRELDLKIKKVYEVLNKRASKRTVNIAKQLMINQKDYEVEEVIKMNKLHVKEVKNASKDVIDYDIYKECNLPFNHDGELKGYDLIVLHNSGRLVVGKNHIPTNTLHGIQNEGHFLSKIRKIPDVGVLFPHSIRRDKTEVLPLSKVKRIVLTMDHAKNGLAKNYLKTLRGSKTTFSEVTSWNKSEHYLMTRDFILSHNRVGFQENHIIIIGRQNMIEGVKTSLNQKNKEGNSWYNFTSQDLQPFSSEFKGRSHELRKTIENGEVKVVGLNELTTDEKEFLKKFHKGKTSNNNEEASELLELAQEQDGRQTILNIEHDLRKELSYLKTRTSSELFYLLKNIEDELEPTEAEYTADGEFKPPKMNKKVQALLNVVQGFKSTKEILEHEGKGLSSDLTDLVTIEKSGFKANKKNKNLYSLKLGLLNRNQNPDNLTKIVVNEEVLERVKKFNLHHVRTCDKLESKATPRKLVQNNRGDEFEIIDMEEAKKLGLFKRGGSRFSFIFSKIKPQYNDVPEEEYHHTPSPSKEEVLARQKELEYEYDCKIEAFEEIEGFLRFTKKEFVFNSHIPKVFKPLTKEMHLKEWKPFLMSIREEELNRVNPVNKVYKPVERKVSGLQNVVQGDLSSSPCKKISQRKWNPNRIHVDYPVDFDYKCEYKEVEKHLTHKVYPLNYCKNLGVKSKYKGVVEEEVSSSSTSLNYEILEEKDGIYKIKVKGIPQILYAKGNLDALNMPSIGMAGIRTPTVETKRFVAKTAIQAVKNGYATVSGLALGCDTVVHNMTMFKDGITIAVLPCGFNNITPKDNINLSKNILTRKGLLLTEYAPNEKARVIDGEWSYIHRNKIIVGLSDLVTIFEAGKGTRRTLKFAKEANKPIFIQDCKRNKDLIKNGDGDILSI